MCYYGQKNKNNINGNCCNSNNSCAIYTIYRKRAGTNKINYISCSETASSDEYETKLNKTSCEEYQDLIKSDEKSLVLIARPTCGACTYFTPILEEIIKEYNLTINYFNTDVLTKEESSAFYNSSTLFQSSEFGTPTLLVVKNSKIIEYHIGYMEKDVTIKWLKEAGFIQDEQ